ncbi:MAG: transcription antitermination factor NusB [Actinobacteria bacterium]|nr:transcription antitermination factor NusB [Actinomycetota bacterium]MCL5445536.1 transcription antitermination factor NusB [Actinomycetota bacterium]
MVSGAQENTRRRSRERALSLLYEAEMKGYDPGDVLKDQPMQPDGFARTLVERTTDSREETDALISSASLGWPLERMAVVDRLILNMSATELLDPDGAPTAVVIDEAVELAKIYSTEESGSFINGILSTLAASVRDVAPEESPEESTGS